MALDLQSIARTVRGTIHLGDVPAHTPVDGLTRLEDYVVVANAAFATLLTGDDDALRSRLERGGAAAESLRSAVFVSPFDTPALRALLAEHHVTAILGTVLPGEAEGSDTGAPEAAGDAGLRVAALHAQLAAVLAEDQAASDRLVASGTKVLTQVARRGGAPAVIAELAQRIDGWAVLLDAHGQMITSAGAGRLHIDDATAVALGRPVRVRHPGLQVHQVGSDRDLTGYLVIASRTSVTSRTRDLASQSAALFDLVLRTRDPSVTERLGREALMEVLLAGGPDAGLLLHRWGVHETGLTAFQLGTRTRTIDVERLIVRWLDELGAEHVFVGGGGRIRGFVPDDLADELAARVRAFTPLGNATAHLGLGLPTSAELLRRSAIQAKQALDTALEDRQSVVRYSELPTVELVLDALGDESSAQLAAVLDGLRDPDGAHRDLTATLRVFLAEHGAQRATAARLGIHRQTLSSRIRRIEELTGLSMERADDRAAAWLALRALGLSAAQP
ncbi:helix-turn-helix domain-containing protein [Arthrobacter sp.]|uniref:helix-turn-helix domain-containing protein n=1 Tax=Arthrobacter sp. TaxID=1667 RepID=UPI0025861AC6|nr:helix-turn-helix domain-containing protein [Arthrobacter sp.]